MKRILYLLFFALLLNLFISRMGICEDIVFDDFEYWDSPRNYGWTTSDPAYPVFGFGIGYGLIETVLDFQQGSRILNVTYDMSVFNGLEPYYIYNFNTINPITGEYLSHKIVSFKIRSQFAVEGFEMTEFAVAITTSGGENLFLIYHLKDGPRAFLEQYKIHLFLGKEYGDGSWHLAVCKLEEDLHAVLPEENLESINGIFFKGSHFQLDDIIFRDNCNFLHNDPPELWHIGPQFASLFYPFSYLIAARDPDGDFLDFKVTVGGYGIQGTGANMAYRIRVPREPNDLYPISYDPNSNVVPPPGLIPFSPAEISDPDEPITPNMAQIFFTPMTADNFILTVTVTDSGGLSDTETFTLSVVNYGVMGINHPPILEDLHDCIAYVNTPFTLPILARDADYGDILTYSATIDNLPSYQYGPWNESIINPVTGVIGFTPKFEGVSRIEVTTRDSRGMAAQSAFTVYIVNYGTWLNHPPLLVDTIQEPQIAKAGVPFTLPIDFKDPDGEKLYYSVNIGTVTERDDGEEGVIFHFNTNFPGYYDVHVIAYDIQGGLAEVSFVLDVQPWWSL
ncbi:MAG: hypothetical protein ACMUIP_11380 [bacterium]